MTNADPVVLSTLDRATSDFSTASGVAERLTQAAGELDSATYNFSHLDAMRAAIGFRLQPDGTFSGDYAGASSAPWARTVDQVAPDALELWAAYAGVAESAPMRAHLHHLLVAAKADRPHQHARDAISAYRAAVPEFLEADTISARLRAVESLIHAFDLAQTMNQRDLLEPVMKDIVSMAEDMLEVDDEARSFGLVYRLLEVLCAPKAHPTAASALIERAVTASKDDIIMHRAFLGLLRRLAADDEARKTIDRRIVIALIDAADNKQSGMLRLLTLNDAAAKAQQAGLTDLAEQARMKMQAMRVQSLGTAVFRVPLVLTPTERERALAEVDQAETLAEALWRIAAMPAPAGTDAVAEQAAKMLMTSAPLVTGIARGGVNPAGPVPIAPANSDGLENTKAIFRKFAVQRAGLAYAEQLDRVWERFAPTIEDLIGVFDCPELGTASRTMMLARAFAFYGTGTDDDASVHIAIPRVESLVREILRSHGVPVLTVAQGATKGGVVQMGTLISNMGKIGFDEDRCHSFALTFTDGEHGLNVRNDVCHGLVDCPPRPVVALVLQAALHLLAVAQGVVSLAPLPAAAVPVPTL